MCCYGVCVQGVHSTGHLQHPIKELAIRVTTLTPLHTKMDWGRYNQAIRITRDLYCPCLLSQLWLSSCIYIVYKMSIYEKTKVEKLVSYKQQKIMEIKQVR